MRSRRRRSPVQDSASLPPSQSPERPGRRTLVPAPSRHRIAPPPPLTARGAAASARAGERRECRRRCAGVAWPWWACRRRRPRRWRRCCRHGQAMSRPLREPAQRRHPARSTDIEKSTIYEHNN